MPGALANFFRRGNLVALRELALRKTAEEVDDSLERYIADHETAHPWATEERIVVCVRPNEVAPKLVRRGHRLARRFQGSFWVVHVRARPAVTGGHKKEVAPPLRRSRTSSAAMSWSSSGDSVADEIMRFAREKRATFVVLGQSKPAATRQRGDPRSR